MSRIILALLLSYVCAVCSFVPVRNGESIPKKVHIVLELNTRPHQTHLASCGPAVAAAVLDYFGSHHELAHEGFLINDAQTEQVDCPEGGSQPQNILIALNFYIEQENLNNAQLYQMQTINTLRNPWDIYQFARLVFNSLSRNTPVLFAFAGQLPYDNYPRRHFIVITGMRTMNGYTEFDYHDPDGQRLAAFDTNHLPTIVQSTSYIIFHSNVDAINAPPAVSQWVPMTDDDLNDPNGISSQDRCNILKPATFNPTSNRQKREVTTKTRVAASKIIQTFSSDSTRWAEYYKVMFPYSIDGKYFVYGQNEDYYNWFIQKLNDDGTLGNEISHGELGQFYKIQFPMQIGGRQFFFAHNKQDWFIRYLLRDGTMGPFTDHGRFNQHYNVIFPYTSGGKQYIVGQSISDGKNFFIQEITAMGELGTETSHGFLDENYNVQCPFSVGDRRFFYGQNVDNRKYFIRELYSNGTMSAHAWMQGTWNLTRDSREYSLDLPSTSFKYSISGKRFRFRQYKATRNIFIEEFL